MSNENDRIRVENQNIVKYRIGIINDFKSTFSFVDYQKYGIMEVWGAGKFSPPHRGYHIKEDAIWVFLNYEKVGVFKTKEGAIQKIKELLKNSPVDLEEFKDYLSLD